MSEKNHAELFIRLLAEALETDRATRQAKLANRTTTCAGRFKQLCQSDAAATTYTRAAMQRDYRRATAEPQDLWFE